MMYPAPESRSSGPARNAGDGQKGTAMRTLVPVYYPSFRCIASACRHTCCAGWEIGVDEFSRERYLEYSGPLRGELKEWMRDDGEGGWVFRLREDGRCPFLREDGLCRIILEMGEGALCDICADHPRWRNFFSDREEMGLGLTCEEAARVVLNEKRKAVMITLSDDGEEEPLSGDEEAFFAFRDRALGILWDREIPLARRLEKLEEEGLALRTGEVSRWRERLLSLERLDENWAAALEKTESPGENAGEAGEKDLPLEQAAVYFVMRHLSAALEDGLVRERCALAVLLTRLLRALARDGDIAEWARMLSSEIEYSDENVPAILEWIRADEEAGAH